MLNNELLQDKKIATIISVLKNEGAKKISIFGSYISGNFKKDSDIDIIVEFSETKSLLDIVGIEMELSEKIGTKVDLLTRKAISPYLIDYIQAQEQIIYG